MRFSAFLTLLLVAFVASCSTFASAESVAEGRRLRADAAPVPVNKDNVAKLAGGFLEKLKTNTALTKAANTIKNSNADEAAVRKAITTFAAAKESAKMSDEGIAKISAMMAGTVQKNPKSWPRLRKFAKVTLGATVAGFAIYGAYKALFDRKSSTAATTTTTTGSA
ncbi:secreted RxLR effector peptide protein, putative [Phytophthora infestans T30-4]|uniref:RxLR effector protein PITG_09218 n=2 Tax=Phytophthora infestans TaxID=4787 RepID=RXLRH_PHYIT|nr:secreted RxLR effector peptide protein, putative [Phytophthora infestans T30-4]D0NB60.1 RecName: Full=RxLR effector protein PITG_09218; Flags: Precursor [Phytophthora infestans T30-4]EEY55289.1 secreted RxLR effector peptide protein, putative [Phytophthora infestans T30-4]KAF4031049.1 hypothetical protein GN244_ATG17145 [Phytophthora infestans]KAF4149162.1 hypothetical protein GN958_ATG01703 [Phytophthora infestans]|eukprot:XP_002903513.1 secreted RxLR effector peptide protein, putative [Phytophthora infestans T30-4]